MNLLRATTTIGGLTMVSRVFGFARDILIAQMLGAGTVSDCFFVAFRFPNLFRRIFAEGAFAAAFVPIFAGSLEKEGHDAARLFASRAFSVLAIILVVFVGAMELAMPWAMIILAPGFEAVEGKMALATELSRIAFPYLLFISLVSLQSGVLNALGRFAAAAFAPVLLNLTLIAAMLAYMDAGPKAGHVLSWGVFIAGVLQFVWLVYHCRRAGMPVGWAWPKLTDKVRQLGRRILPVVFGASLYQINLVIGTILASLISDGAVSYLYYGDRVVQLPLGVVGVAVGTALLPMLSRQLSSGDTEAANHSQNRGLEFALLLTLPATVALMVICGPIITVLFERGAFTAADTQATAAALAAFATGLPAYVLVKVLSPGFFAREDTKTPVKIAAISMVANIVLNVVLMQYFRHVGIAMGASIASWMNAVLLGVVLYRRGFMVFDTRFKRRAPRILAASLVMGASLWAGRYGLDAWLDGGTFQQVTALGLLIGGGVCVFGIAAQLIGAASVGDLKSLMRREQPRKSVQATTEGTRP